MKRLFAALVFGMMLLIPMDQMYFVMQHVDPSCTVIIDSLENMGGEL